MFNRNDFGTIAEKLIAIGSEVRWIAWLVAGFWLGRFLVTQDPIELVSAVVTFALIHLGGLLLKTISGASANDAAPNGASPAEKKEEVVPAQE